MDDIVAKLNRLADLQAQADVIRLRKQELIDSILTPQQRRQIADIEAEFAPALEAQAGGVAALEAEIKADILAAGAGARGQYLQAVWVKGRESVDMQAFKGYALAHPEAGTLIKTGSPSVSIRRI